MKKIIEVKNLRKIYNDGFEAVKNISFDVFDGEIFGFLGPNGAGKTTTLEILETLREKTNGEVFINQMSVDENPNKIKQIIGVQLQQSGFYPNLTLVETINLFSGLYNISVDPDQLLKKVDLSQKAKNRVKQLSGGQKQRFSIAITLINNPKIVFLDEPTTGLDPQARRKLWEIIKNLQKNGKTVVITTHYMDEAEFLCDRVAVIDEGKIVAINTPENLIDDLLKNGFKKPKPSKEANLEDVFLNLTGKELRDE